MLKYRSISAELSHHGSTGFLKLIKADASKSCRFQCPFGVTSFSAMEELKEMLSELRKELKSHEEPYSQREDSLVSSNR